MSLFYGEKRSWLKWFCINILKAGDIPNHIAVIMDGNRRFAIKKNFSKLEGHAYGLKDLTKTFSWCRSFGIKELTVYAFSIENLKRSKEEVDAIMDLTLEKFRQLLLEKDKVMSNNVCIRCLGSISLLPQNLQEVISQVVNMTKGNSQFVLNLCFAYTSREEITSAIRELAIGVEKGLLISSDVNETLLEKCLYTNKSNPPNLVVRTSGVVRLSDFLLWQSSYSVLKFVNALWPEFTFWHLASVIFLYQREYRFIKPFETKSLAIREKMEMEKMNKIAMREFVKTNSSNSLESHDVEKHLSTLMKARDERVNVFLLHLEDKRDNSKHDFKHI